MYRRDCDGHNRRMCGRYTIRTKLNTILRQLHAEFRDQFLDALDDDILQEAEAMGYGERFNVAPTQQIPVVRRTTSGVHLGLMRWGLVPPWADEPGKGAPLINAKSESVAQKPTFRSIIKNKRCLIPADGFYEWEKVGTKKQPHYFGREGHKPFMFAGLWQSWHKSDPPLESCVMLTTQANELLGQLHDRMPVILSPNDWATWLDPEKQDPASLEYLYEPYPAADMASYLVDTRVNNARNEGPDLVEPIGKSEAQAELPVSDPGDARNSR
jgi:putative SOS response-associated peptidase YedK